MKPYTQYYIYAAHRRAIEASGKPVPLVCVGGPKAGYRVKHVAGEIAEFDARGEFNPTECYVSAEQPDGTFVWGWRP